MNRRPLFAFLCLCLAAIPAAADLAPADPARDDAFDIKHEGLLATKDRATAYAFVYEQLQKSLRPRLLARHGSYLLQGEAWGAPTGYAAVGFQEIQAAAATGDTFANAALGFQLLVGEHVARDPARGLQLLTDAATGGDVDAMVLLGQAYQDGIGVTADLTLAENWFKRAAWAGRPFPLAHFGDRWIDKTITNPIFPDLAIAVWLEAARYGSGSAHQRLEWLTRPETYFPGAQRALHILLLESVALGADVQRKRVRAAMDDLARDYAKDIDALLARALVLSTPGGGAYDATEAARLVQTAVDLGSLRARSIQASFLAKGIGLKKDPAAALAIWRELEDKNVPHALAMLGYHSYWGSLGKNLLPKDEALAFRYSARAAALGDYFGHLNTGYCYLHGIGTDENYARSLRHYYAAEYQGSLVARTMTRRLLRNLLSD